MADLDKLFNEWKLGRFRYPELRRKSEDDFFGELVARIKALEKYYKGDGPTFIATATTPAEQMVDAGAWAAELARLDSLEARFAPFEKAIETGMWPSPSTAASDRMAAARAAKAAKRDAPAPEAA